MIILYLYILLLNITHALRERYPDNYKIIISSNKSILRLLQIDKININISCIINILILYKKRNKR